MERKDGGECRRFSEVLCRGGEKEECQVMRGDGSAGVGSSEVRRIERGGEGQIH